MTTLQDLKLEVDSLKEDLIGIKRDTSELLAAWKDAKGALKALAWVGSTARWLMAVGGVVAFLYFTFTGKK
jgi:hypothetical protein